MSTTASAPVAIASIPHLDTPPVYRDLGLRDGRPTIALPSGHEAVHLTRFADVHAVLGDSTFSRSVCNVDDGPSFLPTVTPKEFLLNIDAPDHARMRRVVTRDFSAKGVSRIAPLIEATVEERIDALVAGDGPPDLFATVLDEIPARINCAVLGIPLEDRAFFRPLTREVQIASAEDVPLLLDRFYAVYDYMADLVAGRRPHTPDGLIGRFKADRERSDPPLSDAELVGILLAVLMGGDQNVLTVLTKAVYAVLAAPSLYARIVDDPDVVPGLVEELTRVLPLGTTSAFPRVATRDVPLSFGTVPTGAVVYADAFAANRDPDVFAGPLVIDPDRPPKRHLQFGYGMHHCMGAAYARREITTTLTALARRLPGLRLDADPAGLRWDHGTVLRRPAELPVAW
ncbi:cytochrome P450 [Patulibacter sp. SYSU D01012]|uniref:cytochrome P450 n=1 Tax=Patulibacter sp. SYSU D01012 TaxID=2817381 RepID=UPI001B3126A9|nr:cytochrome P450 [Patulibacter sp. SYSU D01012]